MIGAKKNSEREEQRKASTGIKEKCVSAPAGSNTWRLHYPGTARAKSQNKREEEEENKKREEAKEEKEKRVQERRNQKEEDEKR